MGFEHYYRKGKKLLRCGYTTGTCAALAACAAAEALLGGKFPGEVSMMTEKGIMVTVPVESCGMSDGTAWAEIPKDAGDDADVTDGLCIRAEVSLANDIIPSKDEGDLEGPDIVINGGEGVGIVTKPGLDQPVGSPAINSGPRKAIEKEVMAVCLAHGYKGSITVTISVPGGKEAAEKTFNSKLGIEGGISILGTTGIVEPMSEQALIDTIEVTLHQIAEQSKDLIITPGNYGSAYIENSELVELGIDVMNCSNFLGETLDMAAAEGMENVLLVSHVGKLSKVAAGIMNTHSRYADGRNEVFCAHAAVCGAGADVCRKLMKSATTDACIDILESCGLKDRVISGILGAVQEKLEWRAGREYRIGAVMFSNVHGNLGMTDAAEDIINLWKRRSK